MAMVDSVPAGQYGKAGAEIAGPVGRGRTLGRAIRQRPRSTALVATGEAPYGIVYATDAVADDNVTVVGTFPADSHPAIIYPGALLTTAADERRPRLLSRRCPPTPRTQVFAEQGFAILN